MSNGSRLFTLAVRPWAGAFLDPWGPPPTSTTKLLHSSVWILLAFSVCRENVARTRGKGPIEPRHH